MTRPSTNTDPAAFLEAFRQAARDLGRYGDSVRPGLRRMGLTMHRRWAHIASIGDPRAYRRHRRRCATCNPYGFPPPLAGGLGPAYRHRQLARRRRHRHA